MLALSIRQPYVELILRGIKTIEYRSVKTKIVGERFWIYASKSVGKVSIGNQQTKPVVQPITADNLIAETPPPWILELAEATRLFPHELFETLPRGLIVGSAVISRVAKCPWQMASDDTPKRASTTSSSSDRPKPMYQWHLTDIERLTTPKKPERHPQPIWFRPF